MKKSISILMMTLLSGVAFADSSIDTDHETSSNGEVVAKRESGDGFYIGQVLSKESLSLVAKRESSDGFYIG